MSRRLSSLLVALALACTWAGAAAADTAAAPWSRRAATLGEALPEQAGAHLAVSLRRRDEVGLAELLRDQQDPASPRYHAWLTPEQYGARFGVAVADYERVVAWMEAGGFTVIRYPNRLFLEARGTVAAVRARLGVTLRRAWLDGRRFRSHAEAISLPQEIAPHVLKIGGLDTRLRRRHRMTIAYGGQPTQVLGADDLRTLYDIPTSGAAGLTLVVLGTQEGTQVSSGDDPAAPFVPPSQAAIQTYLTSISRSTATYKPYVLPNDGDDFDAAGYNGEYQLDVEMQSVGAPHAAELALVLSPASEVFQTGPEYIVNQLSHAVAVSLSLGLCESEEVGYDGGGVDEPTSDAYLMRRAVQQGLAEGQTWFAASGDTGADDCYDETSGTGNGSGKGNATADFPCTLPEIVCVGGTQLGDAASWDASGALTGYVTEAVCNEGAEGIAAGGGQSLLYAKPSWQEGVGPQASDGRRDVPDLALAAGTYTPGVATYDCGSGQDACDGVSGLDVVGGTSVSSPLAAGIFANLAGEVGCRLGDVHPGLYALGAAQAQGGAQVFHDVVTGNNDWTDPEGKVISGFSAAAGYDLASGWGSVDAARLVAAWPACPAGMELDAGASGTSSDTVVASGGCGCSVDGGSPSGAWAAVIAGLLAAARRRRAGRATLTPSR
jgi:MYXO-CTERM domain-containing protein